MGACSDAAPPEDSRSPGRWLTRASIPPRRHSGLFNFDGIDRN